MNFLKIFLTPFLLLFFCQSSYNQELDSLIRLSETKINHKEKVDLLNKISKKYSYINIDSAMVFAEIAYKEAVSADYTEGEIIALQNQCFYYRHVGNNQTAIDLLKQAELMSEKLGNKKLLAVSYMMRGDIYTNTMLFDKAFEYYTNASAIFQKNEDLDDYLACKNRLGVLYAKLEKYDEAMMIFQEVLMGAKESGNRLELIGVLNNIATVNTLEGKYAEALDIYKRVLDTNMQNRNYKFAVGNMGNIASLNLYLGDTICAISFLNKSIALSRKLNDKYTETSTMLDKCKLLFEQHKFNLIKDTLYQIYQVSIKSDWSDLAMESTLKLAMLYKEMGKSDSAYDYLRKYIDFKQIVESEGNTKKITELQFKYDLEKEALIIDANTRRKNILLVTLSILFALTVALVIVLLIHFKTRSAKSVLENEKLILEKEKLKLEQQNLTNKLELRNKEITSSILLIQKKNEILTSIANKLMSEKTQFTDTNWKIVENCISELKKNSDDSDWKNFELYFNQIYESFYDKLNKICPNLTANERRLCAYIKLKMNTKEIAVLANSSLRSVEVARYRLRKKLDIPDATVSINAFLENL